MHEVDQRMKKGHKKESDKIYSLSCRKDLVIWFLSFNVKGDMQYVTPRLK